MYAISLHRSVHRSIHEETGLDIRTRNHWDGGDVSLNRPEQRRMGGPENGLFTVADAFGIGQTPQGVSFPRVSLQSPESRVKDHALNG
jgi:hypothetical protein